MIHVLGILFGICVTTCAAPQSGVPASGASLGIDAFPELGSSPETLATFDVCWDQLRLRFFDRSMLGVNWLEIRRRYRPRAAACAPGKPLRSLLREMVAELGTSHTTILHADVYESIALELKNRRAPTFGMLLEETEPEFFYVRALYEGGPADLAGLREGDRIVLVDGVSPDRNSRVVNADYDPGLPGPSLSWILASSGRAVELLVQPREDTLSRRTVTLAPVPMNAVDAARNSVRILRQGDLRIGVLHIWFCSWGVSKLLEDAVTGPLRDCDALILDLRGRGGHPHVVREILSVFQPRRSLVDDAFRRRRSALWGKPVVFLIDERTRSAKEVLAYIVREDGIGTLVGRRTEGAVLGARFFRLPDGSYVEIPTTSFSTRGVTLEGRGVAPAVAVSPSLPFAGGRDPILALGVTVAIERVAESRAASRP